MEVSTALHVLLSPKSVERKKKKNPWKNEGIRFDLRFGGSFGGRWGEAGATRGGGGLDDNNLLQDEG